MHYFGGKSKIAKDIVSVLNKIRLENQPYKELFVGGANVISKMTGSRFAYDINLPLIELYKELQQGLILPDKISNEEYTNIKDNKSDYPLALVGFVGFACSFAGKYFGGYARCKRARNYTKDGKNSIMRKMTTMKDVVFECKDYLELNPVGSLLYCDPPYTNKTGYTGGKFNHEEFWDKVREWSKTNTVVISEYVAPIDFKEIWSKHTTTEIRTKINGREPRIEKLFVHESDYDRITKLLIV